MYNSENGSVEVTALVLVKKHNTAGRILGSLTHKLVKATANSSVVLARGTGHLTSSVVRGTCNFVADFKEGYNK